MTDDLLLATLERMENKIDKLSDEIAEIRGARRLMVWLAPLIGALAGIASGRLHK